MGHTQDVEHIVKDGRFRDMLNVNHSFGKGLTEIMRKAECSVDLDSPEDKADHVYKKLSELPYNIKKATVLSWFMEERRPALDGTGRREMIALCFALQLDKDLVTELFRDVYHDRELYCRIPEEAVYFFCLKKGWSYKEAGELIKKLPVLDMPVPELPDELKYTRIIEDEIREIDSKEDLLCYFEKYRDIFVYRNYSSRKAVEELLGEVQGESVNSKLRQVYDIPSGDCMDSMMENLFDENPIPREVKINFPSAKSFSDITKGRGSYDATRKAIILLYSYRFWITPGNGELKKKEGISFRKVYESQLNVLLLECGLQELTPENLFDKIFLWFTEQADKSGNLRDALKAFRWFKTFQFEA